MSAATVAGPLTVILAQACGRLHAAGFATRTTARPLGGFAVAVTRPGHDGSLALDVVADGVLPWGADPSTWPAWVDDAFAVLSLRRVEGATLGVECLPWLAHAPTAPAEAGQLALFGGVGGDL